MQSRKLGARNRTPERKRYTSESISNTHSRKAAGRAAAYMLADRRRLCAIGFVINLQLRSEAHTSWEFSRTFRAVAWLKRICGGGPTESLFFFPPPCFFLRGARVQKVPRFVSRRCPAFLFHSPTDLEHARLAICE